MKASRVLKLYKKYSKLRKLKTLPTKFKRHLETNCSFIQKVVKRWLLRKWNKNIEHWAQHINDTQFNLASCTGMEHYFYYWCFHSSKSWYWFFRVIAFLIGDLLHYATFPLFIKLKYDVASMYTSVYLLVSQTSSIPIWDSLHSSAKISKAWNETSCPL